MKQNLATLLACIAFTGSQLGVLAADADAPPPKDPMNIDLPPAIRSFIAGKEQQVKATAAKYKVEVWPEVMDYFNAARKGDTTAAEELFSEVRRT